MKDVLAAWQPPPGTRLAESGLNVKIKAKYYPVKMHGQPCEAREDGYYN